MNSSSILLEIVQEILMLGKGIEKGKGGFWAHGLCCLDHIDEVRRGNKNSLFRDGSMGERVLGVKKNPTATAIP
jgi:hypothetical protein